MSDALETTAVQWWERQAAEYPDGRIPEDEIPDLVKQQAHHIDVPLAQALTYAAKAGVVIASSNAPVESPTPTPPVVVVPERVIETGPPGPQPSDQANDLTQVETKAGGQTVEPAPKGDDPLKKPDEDLSNEELFDKYWFEGGEGSPKEMAKVITAKARTVTPQWVSNVKFTLGKKGWKPPKKAPTGPVAAVSPPPTKGKGTGRRDQSASSLDGLIAYLQNEVLAAQARLEELQTDLSAAQQTKALQQKYKQ